MSEKVIVGMSGGVDSSVAAALLKEQGYDVEGVFMKNWSPNTFQSLTDCPWEEDQADAAAVCEQLGIPFRSVNFEKEYKERVVDYFLGEYRAGRTPNPDVMCNSEIKFAAFLNYAISLGATKIATGHYAQVEQHVGGGYGLYRGHDPKKDQSYFLYRLGEHALSKALFPIGGMPKSEVRAYAEKHALSTAKKKDSQGICFIGHIDLKDFLMAELGKDGGSAALLPVDDGKMTLEQRINQAPIVGRHSGSVFYTLGERMGTVVDNRLFRIYRNQTQVPPMYLVARDVSRNRLYISEDHNDRHLYTSMVVLENLVMTGQGDQAITSIVDTTKKIHCQVRYQQQPIAVEKIALEGENYIIKTTDPLWAVAPGQSLVLYEGERVIGGGVVCATR